MNYIFYIILIFAENYICSANTYEIIKIILLKKITASILSYKIIL